MKRKALSVGVLVLALIALMLLGQLPALSVQAATADSTGSIGFYVRAVLPENQLDTSLTYFDLRMQPGQTQTLEVEVVNESDEAITVDLNAISASTNRNGVIDYKTSDIRDKTLEHPFSELAALETGALDIPANDSAMARVTVAMPQAEYDGVVLGGLVFTRRPTQPQQETQGMSLQNQYSYVIGVKLSENDTAVQPDFELESIQGETVNYQPAMVHSIRNRNAAIAKDVVLHVVLRDGSGQVVGELERQGIDMAPNSLMPLAVTPQAPAGEGGENGEADQNAGAPELRPGEYTSEVTLDYQGESWKFEQAFTIGSVEAQQVNDQTIGATSQNGRGAPPSTLLIVLLAAAAVIIIALFVIILLMLRRRKKEN